MTTRASLKWVILGVSLFFFVGYVVDELRSGEALVNSIVFYLIFAVPITVFLFWAARRYEQ